VYTHGGLGPQRSRAGRPLHPDMGPTFAYWDPISMLTKTAVGELPWT